MSTKAMQKRFSEEFKIEAVRQTTERGHKVADVAARLGVSTWSLYQWRKQYAGDEGVRRETGEQAQEVRRLKAELRRVTEERDILKKRRRTSRSSPSEVRLRSRSCHHFPGTTHVCDARDSPQWLLCLAPFSVQHSCA